MRFKKSRASVVNVCNLDSSSAENNLDTSQFNIINIKLGHAQINYFESYCLCDLEEER